MSERKKQVWFRPDQAELTVACLQFVHDKLDHGTVLSDAHKLAGRFTYARLEEIIALFNDGEELSSPSAAGDGKEIR